MGKNPERRENEETEEDIVISNKLIDGNRKLYLNGVLRRGFVRKRR